MGYLERPPTCCENTIIFVCLHLFQNISDIKTNKEYGNTNAMTGKFLLHADSHQWQQQNCPWLSL
jgi:hypothetical protein